ncbi:MAG: S41 family peptidase [Candidatus Hatepunaea meridiana]|nr:S41 family peptidase [Candidatus Hatepunaea meridiana]
MQIKDNSENNNKSIKKTRISYKYILILVFIVAGVWFTTHFVTAAGTVLSESKKLAAVMNLINTVYIEKPDLKVLTEGAIEGMLKRLDPHSIYIPAKEQERVKERDVGEFEGIGISFVIQNELITVIAPIVGTPSERLGIRSGDKIIEIDGVSAFGITNDEVFKKLRGPKGTTVKIKILREGVSEPLDFTIVRAKIPIYSITSSFMLDEKTGYVLLNQFTKTTTEELTEALNKLEAAGMTKLVFDLRNNQGGRLSQAVSVADVFIPGGYAIVSQVSRGHGRDSTYRSTDYATHKLFDLIVLINGGSASASEIVAGAIQDLDRGLIVGSKSFGKGLVQRPFPLRDGGVIRISTAHWYTPLGRLIQRPYDKGRAEYYAVRYKDPDSLMADSTREAYTTLGGRTVYASLGIEPDVKVEERKITGATARLLSKRSLFEFAQAKMAPKFQATGKDFDYFHHKYEVTDDDLQDLLVFTKEEDFEYPPDLLEKDSDYLKSQIKAEMAQLLWSKREYFYIIRTEADPTVVRARELFDEAHEVASVWQ